MTIPDQTANAEDETEATPVGAGTESNEGENTQVATEGQEQQETAQERNWRAANETMRGQGDEIRALKAELQKLQAPPQPQRDKDDIPSVGDVDAILSQKEAEWNQKFAVLEARARFPDLKKTIGKYGKLLPESAKVAIVNSANPHVTAYELCAILAEKDKMANTVHDGAKRVKENLNKVGSASAVGGKGTLSEAKRFENMSEEDVLEYSLGLLHG